MQKHHVALVMARLQFAQHGHHRGDAAACTQQQDFVGPGLGQGAGQHKVAVGLAQGQHITHTGVVVQVGRHLPTRLAFDSDGQFACARTTRQAVQPVHLPAIDFQADAHVLARLKPRPQRVGLQHKGFGIGRFIHDARHPRPHLRQRQQRVQRLQRVFHRAEANDVVHQRVLERGNEGGSKGLEPGCHHGCLGLKGCVNCVRSYTESKCRETNLVWLTHFTYDERRFI